MAHGDCSCFAFVRSRSQLSLRNNWQTAHGCTWQVYTANFYITARIETANAAASESPSSSITDPVDRHKFFS
jgi:sarcosine oxidase delta subunit